MAKVNNSSKYSRERGAVLLIVLIAVLIGGLLAGGYFLSHRSKQSFEESHTSNTNLQTESIAPTGKIVESGLNAEIEIAPAKDKIISGEVTITANNVPQSTGVVGFVLTENKDDLGGGTMLGLDNDPKGGWTKTLDTTKYDNGKYYVYILAAKEIGADPIGSASVRAEIKN